MDEDRLVAGDPVSRQTLESQVIRRTSEVLAQSRLEGGDDARHGEGVANREVWRQLDNDAFGTKRAGQRKLADALGRRVAVRAPRSMFGGGVLPSLAVELPAARAHAEQRR